MIKPLKCNYKKYKRNFKIPISLYFIFFAILTFFLGTILEARSDLLEKYYSLGINKWTIQGISSVTGLLPFSLGEIIYVSHLIALPIIACLLIWKLFKGDFFNFLGKLLIYISSVYILFMFLWGFNYSRISIAEMMNLEVSMYSKTDLYYLSLDLAEKANELSNLAKKSEAKNVNVSREYLDIFSRANEGFEVVGKDIKALSGSYGKPKSIALSRPMLYTNITGMYFPFTAEANVNTQIPMLLLPATTLHEMAHQRGISPEDEANFTAYFVGIHHPDYDFQYSSTVLALIHTMNALSKEDYEMAKQVQALYSENLRKDLEDYSRFWDKYEGRTSEVAEKVNDTYLKSNRQVDGVKSYGRMVDLLLAYHKK